jgi:hypothetical protein
LYVVLKDVFKPRERERERGGARKRRKQES